MSGAEVLREARPPGLQRARELFVALVSYPAMVVRHREVLSNFFGRELRGRFRGTLLGFAWPFVMPLVLFLVYYFVFARLLGARFGTLPQGDLSDAQHAAVSTQWFTVFLFVGVICWTGFAESVTRNTSVILENGNLIKKVSFPSEILPLNVVLVSLAIQAIALVAYLVVASAFGWHVIGWRLIALPALFAAQGLFALGISLAVASANVFVRDTGPVFGIVMLFWQFLSPVFWSRSAIPGVEQYAWVMKWNPLYHLLEGYRRVLVNPGLPAYRALDAAGGWPVEWPWKQAGIVALSGLVAFAVGYSLFFLSKRKFADEL